MFTREWPDRYLSDIGVRSPLGRIVSWGSGHHSAHRLVIILASVALIANVRLKKSEVNQSTRQKCPKPGFGDD